MLFTNANYSFRGFYGEYNYIIIPLMSLLFFERIWIHLVFLVFSLVLFYVPNEILNIYPPKYFGYLNASSIFLAITSIVFYFKLNNKRSEQALAKQKKIALDLMEQKLLRSQMNPHFIFNTMAEVQNSILRNEPEVAASHLSKFCKLIRETMEHSREDYISISEEVDLLQNYVDISNSSSSNTHQLLVDFDQSIDPQETKIPSMILQPFVENAIVHGFENSTEGIIKIHFMKPTEMLFTVVVEDNGKGLNTHTNRKHNSLSTIITKERLMLMSEEKMQEYSLEIVNKADLNQAESGVKIILEIPLKVDA